jgi:spore maturation protein CgeB
MYQWQRIHIFNELQHSDININVFNPLHYDNNENLIKSFTEYISNNSVDMFMTCHGDAIIQDEILPIIKKKGIPSLLICYDNLHAPYLHKDIAKYFDLVWLTSIETKYMFHKWGCKNIIFQPYAANPYIFQPGNIPLECQHEVSFIGTPYGTRISKINELTTNGIKVSIFSSNILCNSDDNKIKVIRGWIDSGNVIDKTKVLITYEIGRKVLLSAIINKLFRKRETLIFNNNLIQNESLSFDDMIKVYNESCLSLNITELRNTYILKKPVYKIHLRTFEIPMAGGLQIAPFSEELNSYFTDGKEIILYKDKEEYIDKVNFYINPARSDEIRKMKILANKRAINEHTWLHRFNNVFSNLDIKHI